MKDPIADNEQAEGSREAVDAALKHRQRRRQGVSNRRLAEERREQQKLAPRNDRGVDEELRPETHPTSMGQGSAGKTGMRSGARKHAIANRGGIAPGKARPKAGASGKANRNPANTVRAKRGTLGAAATTRRASRSRAPRRTA